ncbi:ATP-binding protein [Candidatus Desantisbacteria bacterium]|nr:ATP-binding protein [Candidatus Desantisbacteria bacterium]
MDLEAIKTFNPWWINTKYRFDLQNYIERHVHKEIEKYFNVPQIISLLGLRRSGKTTLMQQYINKLLNAQTPSESIFFFSFEDYLGKNEPEILEDIINIYLQKFLQKDIWDIKSIHYIFLDEIQYINHWQDLVKRFYDKNRNLKFIISGSFSSVIKKKSTESLAGRIFEINIPLLSFSEYCSLKNVFQEIPFFSIKNLLDISSSDIKKIEKFNDLNSRKIEIIYSDYLYKGQFPEISLFKDESMVNNYIRGSILKKILTEDAPKIYKIEKIGEFASIYKIISKETGNLFEILNLAREVGINKDTLNNYLYYMEQLFLIRLIYNYTRKLRHQYRIQKKIYISSPNFTCNELNINSNSSAFSLIVGNLVETAVYQIISKEFENVSFWRYRDKEVDFIIEDGENVIPIEVKYVNKLLPKHLKNLLYFLEYNKLGYGIVITKNEINLTTIDGKKILFLPVWALE